MNIHDDVISHVSLYELIYSLYRSSGSVFHHRSLPLVFESRRGHIWRLFHIWLRFITFGGRSAHLAYHVHKSGRKTPIIIHFDPAWHRVPFPTYSLVPFNHGEYGWFKYIIISYISWKTRQIDEITPSRSSFADLYAGMPSVYFK